MRCRISFLISRVTCCCRRQRLASSSTKQKENEEVNLSIFLPLLPLLFSFVFLNNFRLVSLCNLAVVDVK